MFVEEEAAKPAAAVREALGLPPMDAAYAREFDRLEAIYRAVMAPDMPSYDVFSTQGAGFDEWSYLMGLGCFIAQTQSVEINVRLLLEAAAWGDFDENGVKRARPDMIGPLLASLIDKWTLNPLPEGVTAFGRKVFFPPGGNVSWIVSEEAAARAFGEDPAWLVKPHPITAGGDLHHMKLAHGTTRMFPPKLSGMALLREADTVGYTTASEMGLIAMALGKPAVNFSSWTFEEMGTLYPLYRAVWQFPEPREALNRLLACEWSGIVPLDTPDDEAERRFTAFKAASMDLRQRFRPLTRPLPTPPNAP